MSHERPVEPFSDLHVEHGRVRATLLHDPTVEGLDMAIYMDGSGSMREEYEPRRQSRTLWQWLAGEPAPTLPNQVEPQVQWMLEYLATKDRNGVLRVAYWACGNSGRDVEVVGDLKGDNVKSYSFSGPCEMGSYTYLELAMRDFMKYLKKQIPLGARRGCAVFVTDGVLHDPDAVKKYSRELTEVRMQLYTPKDFLYCLQ